MRRSIFTIIAAAVAALGLAAGASAAYAASSWNVAAGSAPAGTVVTWSASTIGSVPNVRFVDVDSGAAFSCASAGASGDATVGTNLANPLGHIDAPSTTWNGCVEDSTGTTLTVTGIGTWALNGAGDTAAGMTPGTITGISAHVAADNGLCSFDVTGSVNTKFTNGNPSTLEVVPDPTLTISNVNGFGCALLGVSDGDQATFAATYAVTADDPAHNPITITSNP